MNKSEVGTSGGLDRKNVQTPTRTADTRDLMAVCQFCGSDCSQLLITGMAAPRAASSTECRYFWVVGLMDGVDNFSFILSMTSG